MSQGPHDDHPDARPPRSGDLGTGARRPAWRALLSLLAGGGLTAAGLGGPLSAGALAAEAPPGSTTGTTGTTSTNGAPTSTAPTSTTTTTQTTGEHVQEVPWEPTTTSSATAQPSGTTTQPSSTTTQPSTIPAPPPPHSGASPTVVVHRKQQATPSKPPARTTQTSTAPPGGQAGAGGASATPSGPSNVAAPPQLVADQASALAALLSGSSGSSAQALDFYRIPLFLLPIYQAAAVQYDVPWPILAAINEIETNYGTDLSVSSAGAEGWMQFEPATWLQYGVDALNAGYADPYNPVDAIFAAARYLNAAGAAHDLNAAILAYNHSTAYVESVLLRAKLIAAYPGQVIATLTGLIDGRPPVTGKRIGWSAPTTAGGASTGAPPSPSSATANASAVPPSAGAAGTSAAAASSTPAASVAATPGSAAAPAPGTAASAASTTGATQQLVDIASEPSAHAVAVQDGRIVKLGYSRKLGSYVVLQDVYGDVFTYAGLGSLAHSYKLPKSDSAVTPPAQGAGGAAQTSGAVAQTSGGAAQTSGAAAQTSGAAAQSAGVGAQPSSAGAQTSSAAAALGSPAHGTGESGSTTAVTGKVRVFAHAAGNPDALAAVARAKASAGSATASGRLPLRSGSIVAEGTVLGHVSNPPGAGDGHMRFAIRPAGDTGTIDPRAILANWSQLDAALHPQGARGNPSLLGATASGVFLLSKGRLEREVLSDPGIALSACSRHEIASGAIDRRALAVLAFLSRSGLRPSVGALRCGAYAAAGYVAPGHSGDAIAIVAINGVPIAGHQGAGSITDTTIRTLLTLQGEFVPARIVSLMHYPGAPTTLARADHGDYIELVFAPAPPHVSGAGAASATTAAAHAAGAGPTAPAPVAIVGELSAAQWEQLIGRIAALPAPTVAVKPSSAAIPDRPSRP